MTSAKPPDVQKENQIVYQAGIWHSFNLWLKTNKPSSLYGLKMKNSASIKRIAMTLLVLILSKY